MKQLEDVKQSRAETGVLSYLALKTIFSISGSIVLYCTEASCHKKNSVHKKVMIGENLALIEDGFLVSMIEGKDLLI